MARSETMMLWDVVAAVKRLHSKREFNGDGYGWANCAECRQHYPCETIKEIERAMSEVQLIDGLEGGE